MIRHKHGHDGAERDDEHGPRPNEEPRGASSAGPGGAAGSGGTAAGQGGAGQPTAGGAEDVESLRRLVAERDKEIETLKASLAELERKAEALHRTAAELDNRRKRLERQMEECSRFALQPLAAELLPIIDNFERALEHAEKSRDFDALLNGVRLAHDQVLAGLKKFHIEKVEALGKPFDPAVHEAVAQLESAEHPDHTVVQVHQEGYKLHDRLIRPSRVIVSRRPKDSGDGQGPAAQQEAE